MSFRFLLPPDYVCWCKLRFLVNSARVLLNFLQFLYTTNGNMRRLDAHFLQQLRDSEVRIADGMFSNVLMHVVVIFRQNTRSIQSSSSKRPSVITNGLCCGMGLAKALPLMQLMSSAGQR